MSHTISENFKINREVNPYGLQDWMTFGDNMLSLSSSFSFLPVFLLGFFVNRETGRWLGYLDVASSVTGRIEDIAVLLAGEVEGVNDPAVGRERREYLFKAYRYLN